MIKYQIFILDSILICLFWVRVGRACGVLSLLESKMSFCSHMQKMIMCLINTLIFPNRLLAFKIVRFKVAIDNFPEHVCPGFNQ